MIIIGPMRLAVPGDGMILPRENIFVETYSYRLPYYAFSDLNYI